MNILRIFLFSILLITGCSLLERFETSEAIHILKSEPFPPTIADEISILIEKPDKEYKVIAIIESRGMGYSDEARDLELSLKALKNEAASIGAHAVIINSSTQEIANVSAKGTSTERRIKGLAIRY